MVCNTFNKVTKGFGDELRLLLFSQHLSNALIRSKVDHSPITMLCETNSIPQNIRTFRLNSTLNIWEYYVDLNNVKPPTN